MLRRFGWYHRPVRDFAYHFRREGVDLRSRIGIRAILIHLVIIGVFGVWWPYMRGAGFFDPVFLSAYACLGVLFAGPAAAQGFAERPDSMGQAIARIGLAVFYGELVTILILGAGITTALNSRKIPLGPDWIELGWSALLGLCGAFAMASLAAWFAVAFSPEAARMALRVLFLALLALFFFKSRWLPDVIGTGIAMCIGASAGAIFAISRVLSRH
jgi:hypothetical protein